MPRTVKTVLKESSFGSPATELHRGLSRLYRKIAGNDTAFLRKYLAQNKTRKLQLGSGANILPGWLNSDYLPKREGVVHLDATKTYPFKDDTFDYIFSEHMIEHFSYSHGQHMLKECFRVLIDGGKIRISTPDLSFLISLYRTDKSHLQTEYIRWFADHFLDNAPYVVDTFVINQFVRDWGHTFIYDEKVLRLSLQSVGFDAITKCSLNQSATPELSGLENERRMPEGFLQLESLILEATKKAR